jgi:hypothetical protein
VKLILSLLSNKSSPQLSGDRPDRFIAARFTLLGCTLRCRKISAGYSFTTAPLPL